MSQQATYAPLARAWHQTPNVYIGDDEPIFTKTLDISISLKTKTALDVRNRSLKIRNGFV